MVTKDSCIETVVVLKFFILWILGFLPLTLPIKGYVSESEQEITNLLKTLNKPYVKSIKSPCGYIIDCVPINRQPAFDNPLLKNHTIQMKPSNYPKELLKKFSLTEKPLTEPRTTQGRCPKRTVPIKRTTVEDILRAKSIQSFGKKNTRHISNPNSPPTQKNKPIHEYAVCSIRHGEFYGTKADIGLWNPIVDKKKEFSLAQIWVLEGTDGVDLNSIEVGWQVYPWLYNDKETHLFGFWTRDSHKDTGCYNLLCPGFVQTGNDLTLGDVMNSTSRYKGAQISTSFFIFKDRKFGDWWLKVGESWIGYWPANIFTKLQNFATSINWGGEIVNIMDRKRHTKTQMGSGAFSKEKYKNAASFINLEVVDRSNSLITPNGLRDIVTNSSCYDLTSMHDEQRGEFFYYGGPGRNLRCP